MHGVLSCRVEAGVERELNRVSPHVPHLLSFPKPCTPSRWNTSIRFIQPFSPLLCATPVSTLPGTEVSRPVTTSVFFLS